MELNNDQKVIGVVRRLQGALLLGLLLDETTVNDLSASGSTAVAAA